MLDKELTAFFEGVGISVAYQKLLDRVIYSSSEEEADADSEEGEEDDRISDAT